MAEHDSRLDRLHVRLVMGGDMVIGEAWNQFRNVSFPYWTCYINGRPGASLRLADGRVHALVPGRVHLIPAWVRWDCVTTTTVPHLWVCFDLVGIPGSLVRERFPEPRSVPLLPHLAAAADRARDACSQTGLEVPQTQFAFKALVYAVIADLFASLDAADAGRLFSALAPGNPVAPALELIEHRLAEPFTNRALARACGLSEHHFIRTFRRHLGQSPAQYGLERRLAAAAEELALAATTIDEIAERWGFPDRFYFTRMFSRRMGISPAAYRRMKPGGV